MTLQVRVNRRLHRGWIGKGRIGHVEQTFRRGQGGGRLDERGPLPVVGGALGEVADNPYEMLHKVMNGQASEAMPALRALDPQIAVDIVAYLPKLPK